MSLESDCYKVPAGRQELSFEIKASRFITTITRVEGRAAAREFIDTVRQQYSDANHNCWAMVAGQPQDVQQQDQSDDGEPKGTAGKPMLNALQHAGIGNVAVVVTRYFGGTKLGAGGLMRAYTRGVTDALSQMATDDCYICVTARITLPYAELDKFQYWLQSTRIQLTQKEFTQEVCLEAEVPLQDRTFLESFVESHRQLSLVWDCN